MDSPPDKEPVDAFILIAQHLIKLGFNAPTIFAKDIQNGFLLLEDFGDNTFSQLLHTGYDAKKLYKLATDTLIALHKNTMITAINAKPYDMATYIQEVNLFVQWLYPSLTGKNLTPIEKSKWEMAWINALGKILPTRSTLVLRDYHAGNLMLLNGGNSSETCGLLDFQDALIGNPAYDLLSLLEDVRLDIAPEVALENYRHYTNSMNTGKEFDTAYTVLSAQRHAKVLGIFVRLYKRDGKSNYLQYLPRTLSFFNRALEDENLAPVKAWFNSHLPTFSYDLLNKKW